jgi:hypothetical protein
VKAQVSSSDPTGVDVGEASRLERAYAEQFPQAQWSADRQEQFLSWCLDVARQRVNAIS